MVTKSTSSISYGEYQANIVSLACCRLEKTGKHMERLPYRNAHVTYAKPNFIFFRLHGKDRSKSTFAVYAIRLQLVEYYLRKAGKK